MGLPQGDGTRPTLLSETVKHQLIKYDEMAVEVPSQFL